MPYGWYLCGANHHSPPDIHPDNIFNVTKPPADGKTYLGMVARADGSMESIEQVLSQPLLPGRYRLDFYAARSDQYYSYSVPVDRWVQYDRPLHLTVYGNTKPCAAAQLLGRSALVQDTAWQAYTLWLQVEVPVERLQIRVEQPDTAVGNWHGSMLLDGLSPIVPVEAHSRTLLVKPDRVAVVAIGSSSVAIEALLNKLPREEQAFSIGLLQRRVGPLVQINAALFAVARWVARLPERRVVFALHPSASDRIVFAIHRAMAVAQVPAHRYRVKRKKGRGQQWIGNSLLKIKVK
ncbi:MAG: hypothetical protein RIC19_08300 [Phaeodactylibacter sp.]